jgi:hypothetical protein
LSVWPESGSPLPKNVPTLFSLSCALSFSFRCERAFSCPFCPARVKRTGRFTLFALSKH